MSVLLDELNAHRQHMLSLNNEADVAHKDQDLPALETLAEAQAAALLTMRTRSMIGSPADDVALKNRIAMRNQLLIESKLS